MTPTRLTENAIVEAQNSMRVFTHWFGEAPYGRIAITQQPQFNFGQSWPTLVYLPISAFFDSTQRWMLMGRVSNALYGVHSGSHAARSRASVVGSHRRVGIVSRSMAVGRLCRFFGRAVFAGDRKEARQIPELLAARARNHN